MKKILSAIVAASSLTAVNAFANSSFDGFYADFALTNYSSDFSSPYFKISSKSNVSPTLAIGYGKVLENNNIYIGIEGSYATEATRAEMIDGFSSLYSWNVTMKSRKAIGVNLGYVFNDKLLILMKYKVGNADIDYNVQACPAGFDCGLNSHSSDFIDLSMGAQYDLGNRFFLSADIGRSFAHSKGPELSSGNPKSTLETSSNYYKLGIGYRF